MDGFCRQILDTRRRFICLTGLPHRRWSSSILRWRRPDCLRSIIQLSRKFSNITVRKNEIGITNIIKRSCTYVCLGRVCGLVSGALDKISTSLPLKFWAFSYSSSLCSSSSSEESTIGRVFRPQGTDEALAEPFDEVEVVDVADYGDIIRAQMCRRLYKAPHDDFSLNPILWLWFGRLLVSTKGVKHLSLTHELFAATTTVSIVNV